MTLRTKVHGHRHCIFFSLECCGWIRLNRFLHIEQWTGYTKKHMILLVLGSFLKQTASFEKNLQFWKFTSNKILTQINFSIDSTIKLKETYSAFSVISSILRKSSLCSCTYCKCAIISSFSSPSIKFIYSEKATKFWKISTNYLTGST